MSQELNKRIDNHEERINTLEINSARSDEILSRLEATISKLDNTVEKILAQVNQWRGSEKYQWLITGVLITSVIGVIVKIVFKV